MLENAQPLHRQLMPIYYSLAIFILIGLVAAFFSPDPNKSLAFFFSRYVFGVGLFCLAFLLGRSEKWRFLPLAFFAVLLVWVVVNSYNMIYQHHWLHIARAKGFWKNPNPAAISIEIFLPTIIAYMCSRRVSRTFSRFVFIFSVLPMSLGLIASQSRGAWIVSVLVVGIMLVLQRNWRYILGAIGVGCGLVIAYYPIILERAKQTVNMNYSANFERINAWVSSIRIMKENWLGIGFGNFSEIYPQYMLEGAREPLTHAHNIILEFGVSGGPLMAFSFMAFIFFVSRFIARTMTWNDFSTTPMYQGLTFGAIAFIIHGVIDFPLTARIEMWGVFMFMVGLLIGLLCHGQYESNKLYGELI